MPLLPKKRMQVVKGMTLWVSNHYVPTIFGIRGHYETAYKSGQYVEMGSPGTGFFARQSTSKAYKEYYKTELAKQKKPRYWDLLFGKEFSFDKEIGRATQALRATSDEDKAHVLESYVNVLPLAKEAELCERAVQAIKELGHRRHRLTSYQSHVISNFKSRIAHLGHDVRDLQLSVPAMCGEDRFRQFSHVVIAFSELASSHRIWHAREAYERSESAFVQVYFDLGIFDYIQSPLMTPLMRDSIGQRFFLYPDYLIVSRDGVDFDLYRLDEVDFLFREVPYDMISSMVLSSYADSDTGASSRMSGVHRRNYDDFGSGLLVEKDSLSMDDIDKEQKQRDRVVGELYIPETKTRFYVREMKKLKHFVDALNAYRDRR